VTGAFIGISLDSRAFTRPWVRFALRYILERHEHALLVLADELFVYTRMADWSGDSVKLHISQASAAAGELASQRQHFFFLKEKSAGSTLASGTASRWPPGVLFLIRAMRGYGGDCG
jgi:hypothetical protein